MIADITFIQSLFVTFRMAPKTTEVMTDSENAPIITPSSIGDDLETIEITVDRHSIR